MRKTTCEPIANIIPEDESTFACIGLHGEKKEGNNDIYRHCFKSETTDTVFDYDTYDLISVINIFSEAILYNELTKNYD